MDKINNDIREIFSDLIDEPVNAMRSDIDRDALDELAQSIKQHGLINPITVRPKCTHVMTSGSLCACAAGNKYHINYIRYEVVAGHRRFNACQIAGIIRIPCVVRSLDDNDTLSVRAAENLYRTDIDPVDEAIFLFDFMKSQSLSVAEVARQINRSVQYVNDRLAIIDMPDYMVEYVKLGTIKLGHALALTEIDDETTRHMWVELAVRDGVNVRQVEHWVTQYKIDRVAMLVNSDPSGASGPLPPQVDPKQFCKKCGIYDSGNLMRLVWVHAEECLQNDDNN